MRVKELWHFPVPSAGGLATDVKLCYPSENAKTILLFDYYDSTFYDEKGYDEVFSTGIQFDMAQALRHFSEKFVTSFDAYDKLIEILDSEWVTELKRVNNEVADYWNIKHYAILLDSNGLYEIIASGYKILETKKGYLNER